MAEPGAKTPIEAAGAGIRRILIPTDFSELSEAGVAYGIALARQLGATVSFFHCVERLDIPNPMVPLCDAGYADLQDQAQAHLLDLIRRAKEQGVEAASELVDGVPFVEIIRAARKLNADVIVMGTHGRTGLGHVMMGSQAERVVRQSPCPVLTVKSPKHRYEPL